MLLAPQIFQLWLLYQSVRTEIVFHIDSFGSVTLVTLVLLFSVRVINTSDTGKMRIHKSKSRVNTVHASVARVILPDFGDIESLEYQCENAQ